MQIDVITLFPQMFDAIRDSGISRIAMERELVRLSCYNPRDYCSDNYRTIDDRPYGGGPGMVMMPEPLDRCIDDVRRQNTGQLIYLSPQGERLDQRLVQELAAEQQLIFLSGRYEGVDERLLGSRVDREISIGDYVLAGGELAAMVVIEALVRLLPGVLGNEESAAQDSFSAGLLDYPHYTRPEVFQDLAVPPVLLSGNHAEIARWRLTQSLVRTRERRPDLFDQLSLSETEENLLKAYYLEQDDE